MAADVVERQQVAVDRRTFVVTTRTAGELRDAGSIAAELRAAALAAVRDLPVPDARALGDALIAKAEPGRRIAAAFERALAERMSELSRAAKDAVDSGGVGLELTAKPAVPRRGGRTRAQLIALVQIGTRGLVFSSASGLAFVPGAERINLSVARALAARGDIELDVDEVDSSGVLWRLSDSGWDALATGLQELGGLR